MTFSQLGYTLVSLGNVLAREADRLSTMLTITTLGFNPNDNAQCPYFEKCPLMDKLTIGCNDHFGDYHKTSCGYHGHFRNSEIGVTQNGRR